MKNYKTLYILVLTILSFSCNCQLKAQHEIGPPWMAHTDHLLYLLYAVDGEEVKKVLPEGLNPKLNDQGMATIGIEFYAVDRGFGQPLGNIFFAFAEVENNESRSGTPGHFPFFGLVEDSLAMDKWQKHFGFPYQVAEKMVQERKDDNYSGSIIYQGQELLTYSGQPISGDSYPMQSDVNMIGYRNKQLLVAQVPFINSGKTFESSEFTIDPSQIPELSMLRGKAPFLKYLVEDANFSYSRPELIEQDVN